MTNDELMKKASDLVQQHLINVIGIRDIKTALEHLKSDRSVGAIVVDHVRVPVEYNDARFLFEHHLKSVEAGAQKCVDDLRALFAE